MLSEIKQGIFRLDVIDYHAILGVPLDADPKQIRLRYLKIVPRLHPDTCKSKDNLEKEKANQALSKLLNPAYETLSKEKIRVEHQLLLQQRAKTSAVENRKITLVSDKAKSLSKARSNLPEMYYRLIQDLANDQYSDLDQLHGKIAELSEINLVFLFYRQANPHKAPRPTNEDTTDNLLSTGSLSVAKFAAPPPPEAEEKRSSPIESYLRRAEDYKNKQRYREAILELRDALKIDPKNSTCHGLLGLVYLEQKNQTMAKIHINTALEINPDDSKALEGKKALDQQAKPVDKPGDKNSTKSGKPANPGLFSGLFNSKKK